MYCTFPNTTSHVFLIIIIVIPIILTQCLNVKCQIRNLKYCQIFSQRDCKKVMMKAIIHPDRKPCLDVYAHSSSSYFETSHFLFMGFNTSLKCWASSLGWEGQGLSLCCRGSPVKGIGRLFGQLRSVPPKIKCLSLSSPGRALSLYFFF